MAVPEDVRACRLGKRRLAQPHADRMTKVVNPEAVQSATLAPTPPLRIVIVSMDRKSCVLCRGREYTKTNSECIPLTDWMVDCATQLHTSIPRPALSSRLAGYCVTETRWARASAWTAK